MSSGANCEDVRLVNCSSRSAWCEWCMCRYVAVESRVCRVSLWPRVHAELRTMSCECCMAVSKRNLGRCGMGVRVWVCCCEGKRAGIR